MPTEYQETGICRKQTPGLTGNMSLEKRDHVEASNS